MTKVTLRIANRVDLARIVAIYNQAVPSHHVTAETTPATVAGRQSWFAGHDAKRWPLWVVSNANATGIIGWVSLSPFKTRAAYGATAEISIYLDQQAQGVGIGHHVLTAVESQLPRLGIENVVAMIIAVNTASQRLFTHHGYAMWGRLPGVMRFTEGPQDLLILGKHFDNVNARTK